MKIKWFGHAAFGITSRNGVRIIIDPYQPGAFDGALTYGMVSEEADLVLTSHDHDDHNYTKDIKGTFDIIKKAGEYDVRGVKIRAIPTFHDQSRGADRGMKLIFRIETDGISLLHAGDLGHALEAKTLDELGRVDVLLVPVGGCYTMDAHEATRTMNDLKPLITIPMHYKTEKCAFPIAPVDDFIRDKKQVHVADSFEIEIMKENLPREARIVILQNAL